MIRIVCTSEEEKRKVLEFADAAAGSLVSGSKDLEIILNIFRNPANIEVSERGMQVNVGKRKAHQRPRRRYR